MTGEIVTPDIENIRLARGRNAGFAISMKKKSAHIAKISRPDVSRILPRQRLFQRMNRSGKIPLTWVSGPPGSGKTALVNSYVTTSGAPCLWYKIDCNDINPATFFHYLALACRKAAPQDDESLSLTTEHDQGITEYARNFFTELVRRMNNQFNLVLDNYQEIPEDIPLHELLLDALNYLPKQAQFIIISRNEPSAKFSRLRLNRKINNIGWHDLRFTPDEFQAVASGWGFGELSGLAIERINKKMDGWIAGLIFMLESTKRYNTSLHNIGTGAFEAIYSYFSEEIFGYQDSEIQRFFLQTSFMPSITPKRARTITGIKRSCKILSLLHRHNLFVDKPKSGNSGDYVYHPLFREYLADRVEDFFAPDEVVELLRTTAKILFEENLVEEAVELLRKAEDWPGLIDVIVNKAEWFMARGRTSILQDWLAEIPEEKFVENPWLSYIWAQSLRLENPQEAKKLYKDAFEIFCQQSAMVGAFSAWTGLVETIVSSWHNFMELDSLTDWLERYFDADRQELPAALKAKIATAMISALLIRRPQSESLSKWVAFVEAETRNFTDVELAMQANLALANYYLWLGDQSNCWILLGKIRNLCRSPKISSLSVLRGKCLEAMIYAWLQSDGAKCLATVEGALEIAGFADIHGMDHILYDVAAFGAFLEKDYARMADYLQNMDNLLDNSRQHGYFCYEYLSAWLSLVRGNTSRGSQHARQALKTVAATGYVLHEALGNFVEAQILFERGKFQEAKTRLEQFNKIITPTGSILLHYIYFLTKAQFSLDLGKDAIGLKYLRKAMQLGREENYMNLLCWWNPSAMTRLSMHALDNGIETEYVQGIVSRQGLVPASSPVEIEQWPWPLKIYTFGRFEIVKNGKPVRSGGKAQQKPLALLKALIAMGGRNVAELQLADALWPDADGDMQHQSLATTLHRLRRILGGKDTVDFQDGHISLNHKCCWVDAWAFERLLSQADAEGRSREEKSAFSAARYAQKGIELYKGNFLPENKMEHWSIHMRERLKSRFMQGASFLGRNLEKIGEQEKAIAFYLKALEIDPLIEEFYQRLLICYHRLGRHADAVLIFRRCLKNFNKMLGVTPSTQTKALYNNLLAKQFALQEKADPDKKKYNM